MTSNVRRNTIYSKEFATDNMPRELFDVARQKCVDNNAMLVSISDKAENDFLDKE